MAIAEKDKEILRINSQLRTPNEWVEYFGNIQSKNQIASYCYRNNYPLRRLTPEEKSKQQSKNARKQNINQDYFKTWSRNMAYVLGFWFADGCIYNSKMFDITIHKKDKYILKQIANELGYEGPLYDQVDRQAVRLNFSCVIIQNDLVALGGSERKSLTVQFPSVPDEYLSDFIRGYFDGDGCATLVKGNRINTSFCSGSKDFLLSLLNKLKQHAGIKGGSYNESSRSLVFGKRDSLLLGNFMYKNNPELFLSRKREKFQL